MAKIHLVSNKKNSQVDFIVLTKHLKPLFSFGKAKDFSLDYSTYLGLTKLGHAVLYI